MKFTNPKVANILLPLFININPFMSYRQQGVVGIRVYALNTVI